MRRLIVVLCFLISSAWASPSFLTLSDIHYGKKNISQDGYDTGPAFLKIMFSKFQKLSSNANFIIFLGDIPTHWLFNVSEKEHYETLIFHELYKNNVKNKPMFYVPGNNDSLKGNYQPFEFNGISPLNFAKEWTGACAHCKNLIIDDSHMRHDGYYASYVMPKNKEIILIVLNANQWTRTPFFARYPHQVQDAQVQLEWFQRQLKQHHAKQLLIAMHEPPGNNYLGKPFWHQQYLEAFIDALEENQHQYEQITLLTSHTHMEELRKIHLSNDVNIYGYSTPGISRIHHNYPGMKLFHLNSQLQIQNFTTYYTSFNDKWLNQTYDALGNIHAIFPHCKKNTLSECLNNLSNQEVCDHLDNGLFYGVKSPHVHNNACHKIYKIN